MCKLLPTCRLICADSSLVEPEHCLSSSLAVVSGDNNLFKGKKYSVQKLVIDNIEIMVDGPYPAGDR